MDHSQQTRARVLDAVIDLLDGGGDEAVQLREVAARTRVSSKTIYKMFATRDDLIVAALERWVEGHQYEPAAAPVAAEPLRDGLMRVFRHVFAQWEPHPHLLRAYHREQAGPDGRRLERLGARIVVPLLDAVLDGYDADYARDVKIMFANMTYAVVGRFAAGDLEVTEVVPSVERVVFRLTSDNERFAGSSGRRGRRWSRRPAEAS